MRPSATESLYKELDIQEGVYEYSLPAGFGIRPLRLDDIDQVMALEESGFPEEERATREKVEYRLKACPELCAGVFVSEFDWPPTKAKKDHAKDAANTSEATESDGENEPPAVAAQYSTLKQERLVGHIIATKTSSKYVSDESMTIGGHDEFGRTIAVHSLVIDPEHRGRHIGYIMMKDYVQKFFGLCTADQMSLLAHKEVVPFYRKHGFRDEGVSESKFGGVAWRALRLPFDTYDEASEEM